MKSSFPVVQSLFFSSASGGRKVGKTKEEGGEILTPLANLKNYSTIYIFRTLYRAQLLAAELAIFRK